MSNRCVSVDVVENTRAHSLLLKAGIGECAPGEITLGRVWGLTGMRVDENITLGEESHPKIIIADISAPVAWEARLYGTRRGRECWLTILGSELTCCCLMEARPRGRSDD